MHGFWKGFLFLMLIAAVSLAPAEKCFGEEAEKEEAEEPGDLYAAAACIMDADSGRVLYSKNGDRCMANASTTKILTLIVTLENNSPEELVTVSSYAASQPEVKLHIKKEEQYLLKDLCYSLMLESHNDSAVAIAEHVAGSTEAFAELMNQKASEIGCKKSNFITPNGLDAENEKGIHGTTAEDLALILRYCILLSPKKEQFLEITRTDTYSFTDLSGQRSFFCSNHNAFLKMMEEALTGKTGFTGDAGYCYVGAVTSGEETYTIALLACGWPNHKTYKWSDMKKLAEYALANYEKRDLSEMIKLPEPVPVLDAGNEAYSLDQEILMPLSFEPGEMEFLVRPSDEIKVSYAYQKELKAPVAEGKETGFITLSINGQEMKRIPVKTTQQIDARDSRWYLILALKKLLL